MPRTRTRTRTSTCTSRRTRLAPLVAFAVAAIAPCLGRAGPAAAPSSSGEAARAAAGASVLALSNMAIDRAVAYRAHVDALKAAPSDDELCAVVDDAARTAQILGDALQTRRDKMFGDKGLDGFIVAVDALRKQLPGVGVSYGAEAIVATRDDAALAPVATPAARELLVAAAPLTAPWPVWLEQRSDVEGCLQPEKGAVALEKLAKAWPKAPACLQHRMHDGLARSFARIGGEWFCAEQKPARAAAEKFAKTLEAFVGVDGKAAAAALRKSVDSPMTRFGRAKP